MAYILKNEKVFILIGVLFVLMCEFLMLAYTFAPKVLAADYKVEEVIVYRDEITVNELIEDLNNNMLDNELYPIDEEFLTIIDNTYYFGLYQDIVLFITPVSYNNIETDIVDQVGIIISKDSHNLDLVNKYYAQIIRTNNDFIDNPMLLVDEANNNIDKTIDKNNGLLIAIILNNDEFNYIVERKYQEKNID